MNVSVFLKGHGACLDGFSWAVKNCKDMQVVWDTAKPEWLIWLALRDGILTDRELHEFGLFAASQVKHLMVDKRSLAALDAKRLWLDGKISDVELDAAQSAAWSTCSAARSAAAQSAACSAAWSAAAWSAAAWSAAAQSAAWSAAAWSAAAWSAAAQSAAEQTQADYLRETCKPCFK